MSWSRLYKVSLKRPILRGGQRGASPLTRDFATERRARLAVPDFIWSLPWRRVGLHLALFSFWLAVLGGGATLLNLADRKVGGIVVGGELHHLAAEQVGTLVESFANRSFFGISLAEVKGAVMQEPWVDDVQVRRRWPDVLEVVVTEQRPVVRWGDTGLLNATGKLFEPDQIGTINEALPRLDGPPGSHPRVYQQYRAWRQALVTFDLEVTLVQLDGRGAWTIGVNEGWMLMLGKQDLDGRFNRFMANYKKVRATREQGIEGIDMRYSRGMAVRWKAPVPAEEATVPASVAARSRHQ